MTSFITRGQTTAYFFKYYVGNETLTSVFISSGMVASILGIALTGPVSRMVGGKKNLFCLLMASPDRSPWSSISSRPRCPR